MSPALQADSLPSEPHITSISNGILIPILFNKVIDHFFKCDLATCVFLL